MKISEIITDKYKLRIPPTVYYDLFADVQEAEEKQEPVLDKIRAEITTLQNRCYALTKGTMCAFCKYECKYKAETEADNGNNNH